MPPSLYPTFDAPETFEQQQQRVVGPTYGRSYYFDFDQGDFRICGAGRCIGADGHTAWQQWCQKTVMTERFAHLIYGPGYGTETATALQQSQREAVQAELERAITEALTADPRTDSVRGFGFSWSGDALAVTFTMVPVVGPPSAMEVMIGG